MKKNLLFLYLAFIAVVANSQVSIPNGNLENWTSGVSNYPQYYPYNSNTQNFMNYRISFNLEKTTDIFHGAFAVKLFTNSSATDTAAAYFVNSKATDGTSWHGGVPYTEKPTGMRGYYKYNVATADSGLVIASFSKAGSSIGFYAYTIGGVKGSYTLFNFTFNPALSQTPDSVIFGATSSFMDKSKAKPGSTLFIDSVSFTGVVSQPAMLNGDFESWQSETFYRPFGLYMQEGGTKRTTDSYAGTYAAELTTFLGSENSLPVARSGQLATGYYVNSCSCMKGGYPFVNKKDTLVFYYKYTPTIATDSIAVSLQFKKNGILNFGASKNFGASANYKYAQIPFDMSTTPDSVILDIRSSYWTNKAVSYVGAVLVIDEINFKSQMLPTEIRRSPIEKNINVYPNPTEAKFTVQLNDNRLLLSKGKIEVYNEMGKRILKSDFRSQKSDLDLSGMPDGIYFVKVSDGVISHTEKIVKR
jgi:hypothetical protein